MNAAHHRPPHHPVTYHGATGNRLVGTLYGEAGPVVLMLHGGGQTRHAWRKVAGSIEGRWRALTLDQRGHGDSDWVADGAYAFSDFAADAREVARQLADETGYWPAVIGASLGGIAALLALEAGAEPPFSALCLVDIVPQMSPDGVDRIQGFMRAKAADGFASIEEAADAVAAYLPHRERPRSLDGLKRNLRHHPDGRWRWHWDPRFMEGPRTVNTDWERIEAELIANARALELPRLLVRGASSELVTEEAAAAFLALSPGTQYVNVAKARHMVAGDANDAFGEAVVGFLAMVEPRAAFAAEV